MGLRWVRGMRIWLLVQSMVISALVVLNYYGSNVQDLTWQMWCQAILAFIFLLTYLIYTFVMRPLMHRYLRASILFGLTVLSVDINIAALVDPMDRTLTFARFRDHPTEGQQFAVGFIGLAQGLFIIQAFFLLWEVALTLRLEDRKEEVENDIPI
ncbi:hypothetical protein EC968_007740 [Mortierella alpina]|nr:hypothetical protein EC968_007740 [Mortierella alpina]